MCRISISNFRLDKRERKYYKLAYQVQRKPGDNPAQPPLLWCRRTPIMPLEFPGRQGSRMKLSQKTYLMIFLWREVSIHLPIH